MFNIPPTAYVIRRLGNSFSLIHHTEGTRDQTWGAAGYKVIGLSTTALWLLFTLCVQAVNALASLQVPKTHVLALLVTEIHLKILPIGQRPIALLDSSKSINIKSISTAATIYLMSTALQNCKINCLYSVLTGKLGNYNAYRINKLV